MAHRSARTTIYARELIVERAAAGTRPVIIAEQLGISVATVYKWLRRYATEGPDGLVDRCSRPHSSPNRVSAEIEAQVLHARVQLRRGAVFLAGELGLVASTVGRILARHHVPRLATIDPITGLELRRRRSDRRYEHPAPGDLLHVDVKKLGQIPDGGGWRLLGRDATVAHRHKPPTETGRARYDFLHVAIDDHSRLAYVEAHTDERDPTSAAFLRRALTWFTHHDIQVTRVLTDNAKVYRVGRNWAQTCTDAGIERRFIKPGRPWTNGKAERFNRTLLTEFAYAQPWTCNTDRLTALDTWVDHYNTRRAHSAIGGKPPITRLPVNNVSGRNN